LSGLLSSLPQFQFFLVDPPEAAAAVGSAAAARARIAVDTLLMGHQPLLVAVEPVAPVNVPAWRVLAIPVRH
jgi:hypothetical protein